jgi:hypothetical protein
VSELKAAAAQDDPHEASEPAMWHGPRVLLIKPEPSVPESKDESELPQLPASARLSPRPEFMSYRFPHPPDEDEGSVAAFTAGPAPDGGVSALLPPAGVGLGFAGCPGGAYRFLALVAASSPEHRVRSRRSSPGSSPWATKLLSSSPVLARFAVSTSSFPVAGDEAAAIAVRVGDLRMLAPLLRLAVNPARLPPEQPEQPDAFDAPALVAPAPIVAPAAPVVKPSAQPQSSLAKLALPAGLFPPELEAPRTTESRATTALGRLALPPARFPPVSELAPAAECAAAAAKPASATLALAQGAQAQPASTEPALGAPSAPAKGGAGHPEKAATLRRFAIAPAVLPAEPPASARAQPQPAGQALVTTAARAQPTVQVASASATTTTVAGQSILRRLSVRSDLFPAESAGAEAGRALLRLGVAPQVFPLEQPTSTVPATFPCPAHLNGEAAAVAGMLRKFNTNVRHMPRTASTGSADLDAVGAKRDASGMVWFEE